MVDIGPSPFFSAMVPAIPTLPNLILSEDEAATANWLIYRLFAARYGLELPNYYYDGLQKMQDLGISIPPQLKNLRTVLGWPAIGVDALVNRTIVEGFRLPGATDVDETLMAIWQANDGDGESPLAHLDAFIYGRAYSIVGPGDENTAGEPLITYESPINMIGNYDARTRRVNAALQIYLDTTFTSDMFGKEVVALYLPDRTIHMARDTVNPNGTAAAWEITERDDHKLGFVPVARLANRTRLADRVGKSEIRQTWMNTIDSACRTVLSMEVGREFFIAPRRFALGVTEESFQAADGSAKTAWETYMNKVWMLERDEEGQLPTVGEFKTGDPTGHTKILDTYSSIMSGEMGLPPHMLGFHPDGNPASADAIRSGYEELTSRSRMKQVTLSSGHEDTMRIALRIRNNGALPDGALGMETDWRDPAPQTPNGTSDAITKQIAAGAVPAKSDVTRKHLGYSAVERQRLAKDDADDQVEQFLRELADSILGKDARVDHALTKILTPNLGTSGSPGPDAPADPAN